MTIKILASNNLDTSLWDIVDSIENNGDSACCLSIGFANNSESKIVTFNDLNFGYSILDSEENLLISDTFPKGSEKYIQTDLDYLIHSNFILAHNKNYKIKFWAQNNGIFSESIYELNTPIPEKPFQSWTWNEDINCWNNPVDHPSDGLIYAWNEDNLEWVIDDKHPILGPYIINQDTNKWESIIDYNIE